MEIGDLWTAGLTAGIGLIGWALKSYVAEVQRLSILLNRTREEIAKEYVTKAEVHKDLTRILDRIDSLDAKLDRLIEGRK